MKILVTGGTGFIGSHIIENLLKQKADLFVLGTSETKAKKFHWFNSVTFIEHDINNVLTPEILYKIKNINKLIHLAWGNLNNFKDIDHIETILYSHYRFLKSLIGNGITDLTISGTCLEYGLVEGAISINQYPKPTVSYAIAKNSLRIFLLQLKKDIPFNLKWCRIFYLYGKGQSKKSILSQLEISVKNGENLFNMSGGEQIRDYSTVEDIASQIVKISYLSEISKDFNCCSEQPIKLSDFINQEIFKNGYKIKLNLGYYIYNDYEPMAFWGLKE